MTLLRNPEATKDLQLCTRFVLLKGLADAPVAVNSPPVATAHHLIDYTAVGGEKALGTNSLITLCVTAIHCKPRWIQEVCEQSTSVFPSSWLKARCPPLPIYQLLKQVPVRSVQPSPSASQIFQSTGRCRAIWHCPILTSLCSHSHCYVKTLDCHWENISQLTNAKKTTDLQEMSLHQKSIYSWFFTLPQKCRWCCTICTSHSSEHFTHLN